MTKPTHKAQQGGNLRCPGTSFQDLLAEEKVEVPLYLQEDTCDYMGDEDLDVSRWISREFHLQEKEKVWPKVWQMACREEDISNTGDLHVYDIIDSSVIIVRTPSREIKAFINSCLHRGRLLRDEDGCVKNLTCPFHGATWSLEGEFKGIPCKWDFKHIEEKDMSLPQVKVETWGGFVFINFDEDAKPLSEYMSPMQKHFERFPLQNYYKAVHVQRVVNSNWKVGAEAFMESWHTFTTHKQIATFTGDANSQYDYWGDHISRSVTPMGVPSPHTPDIPGELTLKDILDLSGRMALDDSDGQLLPEGENARQYVAKMNREIFEGVSGEDLSDATVSELIDANLYSIFPNFQVWIGYHGNIVYRFIPNGDDHESCLFDVMVLLRYPQGTERPPAAKVNKLRPDQKFEEAPELGALGPVFDQDDRNMPSVQKGMKASKKGAVSLASYQESRIRHLHKTLDKYINS